MKQVLVRRHRHERWLRVASALAAVVVFCTIYALILPAVTLTKPTYCGLAHEHVDACYESVEAALNANQDPSVPIDASELDDPEKVTLVEAEKLELDEFIELAGEVMETPETSSETETTEETSAETPAEDGSESGSEDGVMLMSLEDDDSGESDSGESDGSDASSNSSGESDGNDAGANDGTDGGDADGSMSLLDDESNDTTTSITSFTAKWIVDKATSDDSVLALAPTSDDDMNAIIRLNFQLQGQTDYDVGTIQITIPKTLFKDRSGNDIGEITLSVPEAPDTRGLFSYVETDDAYVLTNTRKLSANANTMVELAYTGLTPHEMYGNVDASKTTPTAFAASMQLTTSDGTVLTKSTSDDGNTGLTATVNTWETLDENGNTAVNSVNAYGDTWLSSWPSELKPSYTDGQYYYVDFYSYPFMYGNQTYSITAEHTASITMVNESGETVTVDTGTIVGYKDQNGNVYKANELPNPLAEGVYTENTYANHYMHCYVAFPVANLTRDGSVEYTLQDTVKYTLTSTDDGATSTIEKTAERSYAPNDGTSVSSAYLMTVYGIDGTGGELNRLSSGGTVDLSWQMKTETFGGPDTAEKTTDANGNETVDTNTVGTYSYTAKSSTRSATKNFCWVSTGDAGELTSSDYTLASMTVDTPAIYSYELFGAAGSGAYLNDDGKIVYGTVEAGKWGFRQTTGTIPEVKLYGVDADGNETLYATFNWNGGQEPVTTANGAIEGTNPTGTSGTTVVFPDGVVSAYTTYETNLGGVVLNTYPTIRMKSTDDSADNASHIADLYANSSTPSDGIYCYGNLAATHHYGERNVTSWAQDLVTGIGTAAGASSSLSYTQDSGAKQVNLSYTVNALIQSNVEDLDSYNSFVSQGLITEEKSGTFYDLLPQGVVPNVSSVQPTRSLDSVQSVRTIENYQGSGRTLLIVQMDLTPTPTSSGSSRNYELQGYYDKPGFTFKAVYAYDDLDVYGSSITNVVAYQSANGQIGTLTNYIGELDSAPTGGNNRYSASALSGVESTMTNLVDGTSSVAGTSASPSPGKSFVYASDTTDLVVVSHSTEGLAKSVSVNSDGSYGDGRDSGYEKTVYAGGTYTYRLTQTNGDNSESKNIILYDSLENYTPGTTDEYGNEGKTSWQGTFDSVDTTALQAAGVAPVVYYSTKTGIDLSEDSSDLNIADTSVWTTSEPADKTTITAIAIDARKKTDGTDFVLGKATSVSAYVKMRAPKFDSDAASQASRGAAVPTSYAVGATDASGASTAAFAFAAGAITSTTVSSDTSQTTEDVYKASNYTKVGIMPFKVNVYKTWTDGDNRDNLRTDSVTVHLYADGADTGKSATLSDDNNWETTFDDLSILNDQGQTITYSVVEDAITGYTPNYRRSIEDGVLTINVVNYHEPEVVTVNATKTWDDSYNAAGARPESITLYLYKTVGDTKTYVTSKNVTGSTTAATWTTTFSGSNLYKYENGEEIAYTVEERGYYAGYVADPSSSAVDDNGAAVITNTYNPYGTLTITKAIAGENASTTKEFTYTLNVTREVTDESTGTTSTQADAGTYSWTRYDSEGNKVELKDADGNLTSASSGTVQNGGTLTLTGGQYVVIEKIPSECSYEVTEAKESGWSISSRSGTSGTVTAGGKYTAAFTNTYYTSGKLNLKATKRVNGGSIEPENRQFQFEVKRVDTTTTGEGEEAVTTETEKSVLKAYNGAGYNAGTTENPSYTSDVTFGAIYYSNEDADKTYTYRIYEVVPDKAVAYDEQGNAVKESDAEDAADLTYAAYIKMTDATQKAVLAEKVATWLYEGVSYTTTPVEVSVEVKDNGDGTVTATPAYNNDATVKAAAFDNSYAASGTVEIKAWKTLVGRDLTDDDVFTFNIEAVAEVDGTAFTSSDTDVAAKNAQPMPMKTTTTTDDSGVTTVTTEEDTAENDKDGNIVFEPITFTQTDDKKTYYYKVTEVIPEDAVAYDSNGTAIKVSSEENADALTYSVYTTATDEAKAKFTGTPDTWHYKNVIYSEQVFVYTVSPKDNGDGTMSFDSSAAAVTTSDSGVTTTSDSTTPTFKNELEDGSLTISKLIDGTEADANDGKETEYTFHVQITGADGQDISGNYEYKSDDTKSTLSSTGATVTIADENGNTTTTDSSGNTISLKPGTKLVATVSNLPADYEAKNLSYEWHLIDDDANDKVVATTTDPTYTTPEGTNGTYYVYAIDSSGTYMGYLSSNQVEVTNKTVFAVYSSNDNSLRFYKQSSVPSVGSSYDGRIVSAVYTDFLGTDKKSSHDWTSEHAAGITSVTVVDSGIAPVNMASWFTNLTNCTSIDVTKLDTSNVVDMSSLFSGCKLVTTLDVSSFDTSNVTNMKAMFQYCDKVESLDLSNFNTSKVTDMSYMFQMTYNTSTATDPTGPSTITFGSGFDTSNVEDMNNMFYYNQGLTSLDISMFDTSKVKYMHSMFVFCSNLETLKFDTAKFDTSNVTQMTDMFNSCSKLTSLDVSKFNTSKVQSMKSMFNACSELTELDVSGFVFSSCTRTDYMFTGCRKVKSLTFATDIDTSKVEDMTSMFYGCSSLTALDLSKFDTSGCNNISQMFFNCSNLTSLDLSNFDTGNVTTFNNLFYGCSKLASITLGSNFTTEKVTSMRQMFNGCAALTSLDLSGFNKNDSTTQNVTTMENMFSGCYVLSSLDLTGFNTSGVTDMKGMFNGCKALTFNCITAGWDVSKVTSYDDFNTNASGVTAPVWVTASTASIASVEDDGIMTLSADGEDGSSDDEGSADDGISLASVTAQTADDKANGTVFAVYSADDGSLRLYKRTSVPAVGDTFNGLTVTNLFTNFLNLKSENNNWHGPFGAVEASAKTVVVEDEGISPQRTDSWFAYFESCTSIDVSKLDFSSATDTSYMFTMDKYDWDTGVTTRNTKLTSITFGSNIDTSRVTDMGGMFEYCSALTSIDVSGFDTLNVTNMGSMFKGCSALTSLDLSNFDTSKVYYFSYMFLGCSKLVSVDVSSFNTSGAGGFYNVFEGCSSLSSLDLSSWKIASGRTAYKTVKDCTSLKELTLGSGVTQLTYAELPAITDSAYTGYWVNGTTGAKATSTELVALTGSDLTGTWTWEPKTPTVFAVYSETDNSLRLYNRADVPSEGDTYNGLKVTKLYTNFLSTANGPFTDYAGSTKTVVVEDEGIAPTRTDKWFYNYKICTSIDLSKLDVSSVTKMNSMFYNCKKLTSLTLGSNFNAALSATYESMFANCSSLTSLDLSGFKTSTTVGDVSMATMFSGCSSLQSITFGDGFDTSQVTNMSYMFNMCDALTSLDLSSFNTSKVTNMGSMFSMDHNMSKLASLNLSSFDTSSVTDMSDMFYCCSALTSLDLSGFNTSNVVYMDGLFYNCWALESLDLSGFDTKNVVDMANMFSCCKALTSLDLSSFDTSNVTDMNSMFYADEGLVTVDVSSFNTAKVTDMSNMFLGCYKLDTLDLSSFTITGGTTISDMLKNCSSLKELALNSRIATLVGSSLSAAPSYNAYTGKWTCDDGLDEHAYADLAASYDPSNTAYTNYTWRWGRSDAASICYLHFSANGGTGGMSMQTVSVADDYTLPDCSMSKAGYSFVGWKLGNASTGTTYTDGATIPANVLAAYAGKSVTLYAQWKQVVSPDATGGFDVTVKGNESVTISGLPGGASYSVYEKTTDGWVLVGQSGTSGTIPAAGSAQASFVNKKGSAAQATLTATKTMDGTAAASGAFSFTLTPTGYTAEDGTAGEASSVPMPGSHTAGTAMTTTNGAGGSVNFGTVSYTQAGTYTYTMAEVINENAVALDSDGNAIQAAGGTDLTYKAYTELAASSRPSVAYWSYGGTNYDATTYTVTVEVASKTIEGTDDSTTNSYSIKSVKYQSSASGSSATTAAPKFANKTANGSLTVTKTVNGSAPTSGTFTFTLTKDGGRSQETITLDGTVDETETTAYSATLSLSNGTKWTLTEDTASLGNGYSFGSMKVGDGEASTTNSATGTINASTPTTVIVNNAYAASGSVEISAKKTLKYSNGESVDFTDGDFTFEVYKVADADDGLTDTDLKAGAVTTGTASSDGTVTFEPFDITASNLGVGGSGVEVYAIREVIPDDATNPNLVDENDNMLTGSDGISPLTYKEATLVQKETSGWTDNTYVYDARTIVVKVESKDNGSGNLTNTVKYVDPDTGDESTTLPTFANKVADGELSVSKYVTIGTPVLGAEPESEINPYGLNVYSACDKEFSFTVNLKDADGNALPGEWESTIDGSSADNVKDGDSIKLTSGQTLCVTLPVGATYTLTEDTTAAGTAYTPYVLDSGNSFNQTSESGGTITANGGETEVFANAYAASGSWSPIVTKELTGGDIANYTFTFKLYEVTEGKDVEGKDVDIETEVSEATNDSDGTVTFPALEFSLDDAVKGTTHKYRIREVNDSQSGVTYDGHFVEFVLGVSDDCEGNLSPSISGKQSGGSVTTQSEDESDNSGISLAAASTGGDADDSLDTFKNSVAYELPNTGGIGTTGLYALGALLAGGAAAALIAKLRRRA